MVAKSTASQALCLASKIVIEGSIIEGVEINTEMSSQVNWREEICSNLPIPPSQAPVFGSGPF